VRAFFSFRATIAFCSFVSFSRTIAFWPSFSFPRTIAFWSSVCFPGTVTVSFFFVGQPRSQSCQGVISHLTQQRRGNVYEKGIATVASKSVQSETTEPLKNIGDLTSDSRYSSKNEPGQWVRWDCRQMRVRPNGYTLRARYLKSWVVEGSLDAMNWKEIDRQTDNQDFQPNPTVDYPTASFRVPNKRPYGFLRLTQTDKNHRGNDFLFLSAVEFVGELRPWSVRETQFSHHL
jgi:hypothetical protein